MRFGSVILGALAVVTAGCGRIGFDPMGARADDAGIDGVSSADATVCQAFSAWGMPQEIAETTVNGMQEYGGQILPDGLTLYFDRHGASTSEMFVTRRPDRNSAFGTPQSLGLGTGTGDCCATLSANELELYFERNTGTVCIYRTTRASTTQPWNAPMQVAPLCTSANEGAYLTPDGLSLYYSTDVGGTDLGSLMVTTRAIATDSFTTAGSMVNGITASPTKGYPALSADQLSIYFEASDLFEASRPSIGAPFGTPAQIPGINSTSAEQDVSITADGLELYFASSRANGTDRHLYVAKRTCL